MKASDNNNAAQYQNPVWLRAAIPARPVTIEGSWMGGYPKLPDPFQWPSRGGQPYQFLCQINCASLPRELWGGLGPRSGWLAFFTALAGPIGAKVIYAADLGPERRNENAWLRSATYLRGIDDRYSALLAPPAAWGLKSVLPHGDESCIPSRTRPLPIVGERISIATPEYQPVDWVTHDVLLDEMFLSCCRFRGHRD